MANKSVLGNPSTVSKVGKEGFNMNQTFTFTASTGMLLPTWYDYLSPGEKVSGFPSFLLRSDPFLAPAMADLDCYVDVFFVPMNKIFSAFGEWFYQIDDLKSNFFDNTKFMDRLPIVESVSTDANPFSRLDSQTFEQVANTNLSLDFDNFGFGMHRLIMHLGRNPQSIFWGIAKNDNDLPLNNDDASGVLSFYQSNAQALDSPKYSPWLEACYQAIYMDYFRPDLYETNDLNAYNLDTYFNDGTGKIPFNPSGTWKSRGIWNLRYRCKSADYFVAAKPAPLFAGTSMLPDAEDNLMRVNQWLTSGINPEEIYTPGGIPGINPGSTVGAKVPVGVSGSVGFDRDKWDTIYDNPLPAGVAVYTDSSAQNLYAGNEQLRHYHSLTVGSSGALLTTARLRTMFALEKLAKITYRAGKHYDDQTLAHFGYKVPQGISGEVYHLKSYHSPMIINRVISLAGTSSTPLGEQAANAAAMLNGAKDGGKFSFTAPCHGVVMALFSIAPRYKYIFTQDKFGYKTKLWDFFKPALDNLGMQPLFSYELTHQKSSAQLTDNSVIAWQWRFMEDKCKFDRVTCVFACPSKNPWSMVAKATAGSLDQILVSPISLNAIFNVQYDPIPRSPVGDSQSQIPSTIGSFPAAYLRDPFTIDFVMKANKASYMSTYGDTPINGI